MNDCVTIWNDDDDRRCLDVDVRHGIEMDV